MSNYPPLHPFIPTPRTRVKRRPLYALTLDIVVTYKLDKINVIPNRPRKVLTKQTEPRHNNGLDNSSYELIVAVDDNIGSAYTKDGDSCALQPQSRYVIISALGSGTFGQVVKCRNCADNTIVAVKILKSKPVFFRQGMLEIAVLTTLKDVVDPQQKYHTVKMLDHFLYHGHVCIVFELLAVNLYDVLRSNKNAGLGIGFSKHVMRQLLESLHGLTLLNIIHCDVKTENVLLQLNSSDIKLIDFGSACFERSTLYTYIQSRHYRAIEIILGLPYTSAIDMWSFGCVAAELFLGIPLFPGENEYNQLAKIIDMLGPIPVNLLKKGTKTEKFFNMVYSSGSDILFELKSPEQFERENSVKLAENRRYYPYRSLQQLCAGVPLHRNTFTRHNDDTQRILLLDFLSKILVYDPSTRMSPSEALAHPFIKHQDSRSLYDPPLQHMLQLPSSQEMSISDVVRLMYGSQYTLPYLLSRDRYFSQPHNYYQAFVRALKCGVVLNILHPNPFRYKPLKIFNTPSTHSWNPFLDDDSYMYWGSNSDSEEHSRVRSASYQSPSHSPRISLRPPVSDPRKYTSMVRDYGHYPSPGHHEK
ncbi:Serine/threonine protein kinase ppk15 [Entamoeba marina]